jgi:hypothetical protein
MTNPITKLNLVKQQTKRGHVTITQILALLGPEEFDAIDAKARQMRESYHCPFTVRDHQHFKDTLADFWRHHLKTFFNWDYQQSGIPMGEFTKNHAYQFIEQHLGGYKEILTAERNAITGRDGGMIDVLDKITEAITKLQTELYIRSVFFELIEPSDYDTRLRLAEELLKKYGPVLFPGEALLPIWIIGTDLEAFIQGFVTQLQGLRRQWRR